VCVCVWVLQLTPCFSAEQLPIWNGLTRTHDDLAPSQSGLLLASLWLLGWLLRYLVFFPLRLFFAVLGVASFVVSFSLLALMGRPRHGRLAALRTWLERRFSFLAARCFVLSWSAVIRYHHVQNRARNGICVANHTSPIDCIVLANDNCYSMVGQRHGGFIGLLQKTLSIAQVRWHPVDASVSLNSPHRTTSGLSVQRAKTAPW
jgi:glycerol-3-phosphate O-acyltransferase 3/4